MSSHPDIPNFTQINLNAFKNTKLFQKFMQNKSQLMTNSTTNLIQQTYKQTYTQTYNQTSKQTQRQTQSKKQNPLQPEEVTEGKWKVNRVTQKANNPIPKQPQQNSVQKNIQNEQKFNKYKIDTRPGQQQQQPVDNFYTQPYRKGGVNRISQNKTISNEGNLIKQSQKLTYQSQTYDRIAVGQQRIQARTSQQNLDNSISYPNQNKINPPTQARRKRDFNPNFEAAKRLPNNNNAQQKLSSSFNSKPFTNQFQDHIDETYQTRNFRPQPLTENNYNFYNVTAMQQRFEEKPCDSGRSPNRGIGLKNEVAYSKIERPKISPEAYRQQPTSSNTIIAFTQGQYKQKFESLLKKYQQLKQQFKNESKNRKKQYTQWEHEIQMIKEKLFDVQSREDSLLIQNQRLKEKWQTENLLKTKTQEQNKELGFKLKDLQDQLLMKDNLIKQKADEAAYYKTQADSIKQETHSIKLMLQKRNDQYNILYGDYQIIRKQRDNKDYLLQDLRRNIGQLVEENSAAKDQLFRLVTKLYQLEQENQVMKNDLKRQQFDNSQMNSFMKDLQQQTSHIGRDRIQSNVFERPQQRFYEDIRKPYQKIEENKIERNTNMPQNQTFIMNEPINNRSSLTEQERPIMEKQTKRRGEFARERGQVTRNQKPERDQRPLPTKQNFQNINTPQQRLLNQPKQVSTNRNKGARVNQILEELEKIKDLKAMNGAIRRRKIDLERQLQELESQ